MHRTVVIFLSMTHKQIAYIILACLSTITIGSGAYYLNKPTPTPTPIVQLGKRLTPPSILPSPTPEESIEPTLPSPTPSPIQKKPNPKTSPKTSSPTSTPSTTLSPSSLPIRMIKDVGEPQYDNFGLNEDDFKYIRDAGFNVIGVNFDICAHEDDVNFLLHTAQKYNLKVVMPAGSGEAEWGYACDTTIPLTQAPVWQKDKVQAWVKRWKDLPAVYGWDISNEDGQNLPNGENNPQIKEEWIKFALTTDQLQTAYRDVKAVDSNHPIIIRMNGFWFYENESNFFQSGNAFGNDVADIVMVNTYSNILHPYDSEFVTDILNKAFHSIPQVDGSVKILPSIAAWKEPPLFDMPTIEHLQQDYNQAISFPGIYGMSYFKYGAPKGNDWYIRDAGRGNPTIWKKLIEFNGKQRSTFQNIIRFLLPFKNR